jgi:hypothetical protein
MPPYSLHTRKIDMPTDPPKTHDPGEPDRFFSGIEPGQRVRHPGQAAWGEGQVQSVVGARVTVNFENAGKVLINARLVALEVIDP